MAINLQGLIDEVLKMAQERHAIETGSDRGSNAWNARQVDEENKRQKRKIDEADASKLLGDREMGLQGLKNTGLTDTRNIMETGATLRERLGNTSKENIEGTKQATALETNRSGERVGAAANIMHENVARITGEAHVGAAKAAHEIPGLIPGAPGKTPPPSPASTTEAVKSTAETAPNIGQNARIALGAPDNKYDPTMDQGSALEGARTAIQPLVRDERSEEEKKKKRSIFGR